MSGQAQKMKSFNLNAFKKQKQMKQKKEEEEKATAAAYDQFVASFEDDAVQGKLFVRGTVINAGSGEERPTEQTGRLYIPEKLGELPPKKEPPPVELPIPPKIDKPPGKRKEQGKKKSNLELFKEELKMMQEVREERHRLKSALKGGELNGREDGFLLEDYRNSGSYHNGDPNTTNIYLGNLNPLMSEMELCELFGQFGPLASVKIMWPRSDEERSRGKNCGFVAYMNRLDGERAMKALSGQDIRGFEMKLGWGRAVPIPSYPVYLPPVLQELTQPPPPSGLPFNAQPDHYPSDEELAHNFDEILRNAVVKVVIPTDRNLLGVIHRMVEFVVREGSLFEAMIMNREINNPLFSFLYDNQSPAHVYYRWRLFSVLHGEHPSRWRQEEFRMFVGGSIWRPPPYVPFQMGMPEDLLAKSLGQKGALSDSERDELENLLRRLTPERSKIAEAMVFCIHHAECAEEVVECITESLSLLEAPLYRKVARLYLVSDILHNCAVTVNNATSYRRRFEAKLPDIFKEMNATLKSIEGRLRAEQFKHRVMYIFRAWEEWDVFPSDFLVELQNIFLDLLPSGAALQDSLSAATPDDLDGLPIAPEELDGLPLPDDRSDIDGVPLGEDPEPQPSEEESAPSPELPKFVPSKWETIEVEEPVPVVVAASKWDLLEEGEEPAPEPAQAKQTPPPVNVSESSLDTTSSEFSEERRAKLREIELRVMKFQDELESGKRSRKAGMTIPDQVEHYRKKLLRKERERLQQEREELERKAAQPPPSPPSPGETSPVSHPKNSPPPSRKRSHSPRSSKSHRCSYSPKRHSHRSRSRSPKRRRSRSPGYRRSPPRKSHKSRRSKH